jgi:hypothetical protein
VDLIDERGGELFNPASADDCKVAIEKVLASDRVTMGVYNTERVRDFSVDNVVTKMKMVYKDTLLEKSE